MKRSPFLLLTAVLSLVCLSSQQQTCHCDQPNKSSDYWTNPVFVRSATADGGFPDLTNGCFANCSTNVNYTGKVNITAGWKFMLTMCDIEDGYVEVFDASSSVPFATLSNSSCVDGSSAYFGPTFTSNLTVKFSQPANAKKPMYVVVFMTPADAAQTTTVATTPTTTTLPPYNGPLAHDPASVQMELAVMIDASRAKDDAKNVDTLMKNFATSLVAGLQVHTDNAAQGTRLSALMLTPSGGAGAAPWSYTKDHFTGYVKSFPFFPANSGNSKYKDAITQFISNGFNEGASVNDPGVVLPRKNSPRVIVLLAAHDAGDDSSSAAITDALLENDVWPVVVNFGSKNLPVIQTLLNSTSRPLLVYSFNQSLTPEANAAAFFNSTIINADILCPLPAKNGSLSGPSGVTYTTPNYQDIKVGHMSNGQKGRYCNFHNVVLPDNDPNVRSVTIKVTYELEAESDFLRVSDDSGNEQAVFTGYDVDGSTICFPSIGFKAQFVTNNQNVFGGFKLNAKGSTDPCK